MPEVRKRLPQEKSRESSSRRRESARCRRSGNVFLRKRAGVLIRRRESARCRNTQETSSPGTEQESSSESESASEPETQEPSSESGGTSESETQKPQWPQGHYLVRITDAAVKIPEGGRIYDGTDRIDITFHTQIDLIPEEKDGAGGEGEDSGPDEEVPGYQVSCSAHLEGADAGEQKVVCSFSLQTSHPEHVELDEATTHPDLKVKVRKAVLSVAIPDGTKRYGDPADLKHIRLRHDQDKSK